MAKKKTKRKASRRGLGSPSAVHERKFSTEIQHATWEFESAAQKVARGACVAAYEALTRATSHEVAAMTHASSMDVRGRAPEGFHQRALDVDTSFVRHCVIKKR